MSTKYLTSNLDVRMTWNLNNINSGITLQDQQQEDSQPKYIFTTGQHNLGYYRAGYIPSGSSLILDLMSLNTNFLGSNIDISFTGVKSLSVQNVSPSSNLQLVGDAYIPSGVSMINSSEIGPSGIFDVTSKIDYPITSTQKRVELRNTSNIGLNYKIIIIGRD